MVEVFKTDVHYQQNAANILAVLYRHFPMHKINFDLEDCDRILRVEGDDISNEKIIELLDAHGHQCMTLE